MAQQQRTRNTPTRRRAFRAAGITLLSVFSLLLWSRLKMVTDTPRMVYAVPPVAETTGIAPAQNGTAAQELGATSPESEPVEPDKAGTGHQPR